MRIVKAAGAVLLTMVVLDLVWLGLVAKDLYADALGPLLAKNTVVWAAVLFYLQYVLVLLFFAVVPSTSFAMALKRGFGVGWVGYATYELTNMALIEGWPLMLVPVDIAWGLLLSTVVAGVAYSVVGPAPRNE